MSFLLAAGAAAAPQREILRQSFESQAAVQGAGGSIIGDVSFVPGSDGSAADLSEGCRIELPLPEGFDVRRGTIEFRVKPHWPPDDGARHTFVHIGGGHQHMTVFKTQGTQLFFVYKGGEQYWRAAKLDVRDWKPDEWHRIVATWFPVTQDRLAIMLQADGETAMAADVVPISTLPKVLRVGERIGPAGPEPAMAVIDELRVSARETIPSLPKRKSNNVVRIDAGGSRGPLPRVFDFFTPWNTWRHPVPFGIGSPTYHRMKGAGFRMARLAALGRLWLTGADVTRDADGKLQVDFSVLDRWVDVFTSAGIEPYFRLGYDMPKVMSSSDSDEPRIWAKSPPRDYAEWEELCYRIVRHYNVEKKVGARYWVIWNEPDLKPWWRGTVEEWLDLYRYAVRGAKRADPTIKVGGPATTARVVEGKSLEYLLALLRTCRREKLPLDFIAFHGYKKPDPADYETLIRQVKAIVEREYPGLQPEYFLDEWNLWSNDKRQDDEYGAAYIAAALHYQMRAGLTKSSYVSLNYHTPLDGRPRIDFQTTGTFYDRSRSVCRFLAQPKTCAGVEKPSLFLHPPGGPNGQTWADYDVALPKAKALRLAFSTGIAAASHDGMTFSVSLLGEGNREALLQTTQNQPAWQPHDINLSPHAGKRVAIRFAVGPGAAGNASADHGCFGEPRLIAGGKVVYDFVAHAPEAKGGYGARGGPVVYGERGSAFGSLPMIKGNVVTPIYFVFKMYNQLGDGWLPVSIDGGDDVTDDGCLGAIATRRDNELLVLLWHFDRERGDLSQTLDRPEFAITRDITVQIADAAAALGGRRARVSQYLIDAQHSNAYFDYIVSKKPSDGGQYNIKTGRLARVKEDTISLTGGEARVSLKLPNLAVTLLRLTRA